MAGQAGLAPPDSVDRAEIVVVGAGFAGLAAAMALRRAGHDDVLVLERARAVGGTWRDNTYPGIACDVPSHLYGFRAHPNPDWSAVYAPGDEIRSYLEDVARAEGIRPALDSPLWSAVWDGSERHWRLTVGGARPRVVRAAVLVLACGRLTEPTVPDVPGLDGFAGPSFHSARWDHAVDLAGARVAVVGTGASAVQLVPPLARAAAASGGRVTLFQRTPAWIVPRGARPYTDDERHRFDDDPQALAALRAELYAEGEDRFASRSGDPAAAARAQAVAQAHLAAQVADPALRAALTPDYAFGCKRVLLSDDFYPVLADGSVRLEPSALVRVAGDTLVADSGRRHRADVLVLATGFASSRQPYAELVTGEGGETLAQHWSTGMTAFASTVVSGFPNLFVLNGPNASLGHNSSVLMLEEQAGYLVRCLDRRGADGVLRVRPEAERTWTAEIDAAAADTPWVRGGCENWYVDRRSGRLTLLWPGTVEAFRDRLAVTDGSEFE
ncbi:flavin-containing monooxygenase [Nakamurella flava]|nr:NAD(P)/FAD-dependent oxidoreductase [Nakamurella flava]